MARTGTILVGTIGQGVMTSADDGESWTRAGMSQGMHSDCIVRALAPDPRRPDVVYAGTDMGLYASEDRGARWRLLDTPMNGSMVDRKSTRLNSSHVAISYAVFCLKKK